MDFTLIEQDKPSPDDANELPTYDDLATQNGPNSRFGRWRGWIEKRAAERYTDITPEVRARRKQRGWGNEEVETPHTGQSVALPHPGESHDLRNVNEVLATKLHIQTTNLSPALSQSLSSRTPSPPLPPLPFVSQKLSPTHLKISHFGSRFLPHTTSPIRCLLPLESDRLLLIGHDEGLSVLNMFPQDSTETGSLTLKGPDEAQARLIWRGESVCQMSLLEVEGSAAGSMQGVVLILIGGAESQSPGARDSDSSRSLRMYNLASLISLAKWAVTEKGVRPLDLHRPPSWQAQTPPRRNKPRDSIARGLENLIGASLAHVTDHSTSSYSALLSPSIAARPSLNIHDNSVNGPTSGRLSPNRRDTISSWDVVEDLPLRWATDFVPLATSGSRLGNAPILSHALWSDDRQSGKGGRLLAVATKNNIFLYETPKGERAFRFVKEFYTPLQPRNITFFQQSVQDIASHKRANSTSTLRGHGRQHSASSLTVNYGTHLGLFIVFDKKAGWIRLADSAVGELELNDVGNGQLQRHVDSMKSRPRISVEGHSIATRWIPLIHCELPLPNEPGMTTKVYLLTRGRQTHIVPAPLRCSSSSPPLCAVTWHSAPINISARICQTSSDQHSSFMQLIAFGGENGLEVQEISLSFLGKGKQKARAEELVHTEEDFGGDAGYLCSGGHWDASDLRSHSPSQAVGRMSSMSSAISGFSVASVESTVLMERWKREEGIYGWYRKGVEDWRVFWVGGSGVDDDSNELSY